MERVKEVLNSFGNEKTNLIQIMLKLQEMSGTNSLPKEWVEFVAKELNLPISRVYGVITFYAMFGVEPRGKFVLEVCKSAPCHVTGGENLLEMIENVLKIKVGETTEDGVFTLIKSACFGACDISPAIKIGDEVYGNLTEAKLSELVNQYRGGQR